MTTQIGFLVSLDNLQSHQFCAIIIIFFFVSILAVVVSARLVLENTLALVILVVSVSSFSYLLLVGPEKPRTLTPEWEADSIKKAKRLRANPITGISSTP